MDNNQVLDKLSEIFKKTLEIDYFNPQLSMESVPEWDSLKHIQLIVEIEEGYGIQIYYEDVLNMVSIPSIIQIIKKYIKKV